MNDTSYHEMHSDEHNEPFSLSLLKLPILTDHDQW